ncbi:MAG: HPr family phosphocarrier protein [Planctomycetota bacterium]|jgi:phosphocarrier protein|nr:HPr family phosphocarrier protein [Planctomycetota bacterium]
MGETFRRSVTVKHRFGIHARPAAKIVSLSNTFSCDINIVKEGEPPANAKNILDIMMLAAGSGARLEIRANGSDAQAAIERLGEMLESDFEIG